ncbi:mycothiol transferase [Rhodococcus zopfii]|uniref:mycothiol transferase n=1 Tax=Rhodococcus zopfii TaxID=43772 RepID=UPI00352920A5
MSIPTESDLLLKILGNQHNAFRNAVSGLTDEQARSVPSASSMSLASLLAHVVDGEVAAADRVAGTNTRAADPVAAWTSGWLVADDETVADQITRLEAAAVRFAQAIREEPDLDRVIDLPDDVARYLDQGVPFTVRFLLIHQIEEWARHAGHADIIRESIDGATADALAGRTW